MSENSTMEVIEEAKEVKKNHTKSNKKDIHDCNGRPGSRLIKRILLSLTKPSYTLVTGSENVRVKNRARLRRILSRLVRRHNWEEASGVLSVLLKGTGNEKSPSKNRTKYWVAMELLQHVRADSISSTKIQHVYETWMKRIGSMNKRPTKDSFLVQLEFILFCLRQGNVEDAHQAALCLMQLREFGSNPISHMIVGLNFCQLWYSTIPKEFQLRDSNESCTPMQSETEMRFSIPTENSEGHDAVDIHKVDSDTSVRNDKDVARDDVGQCREVSMEVVPHEETTYPNHQSQGFYMNTAEDSDHDDKSRFSNHGDNLQFAPTFNTRGLESWLVPLQLSHPNKNFEDLPSSLREMLNDYYKGAVKHLRLALYSTPPVNEALLPLVQMLLLGDHIDEALNELEKFGHNSETTLPLRAKTSILEHFDSSNFIKLSTCFEDILKKDPTCSHSLAKLMSMHQNGDYSPQQLLEMIALHLDATYAECDIWKEFASCFLKLHSEDDRVSICLNGNEGGINKQGYVIPGISKIFTDGVSGKAWRFRCRWWLTRHFSHNVLRSEISADDLQLLTYKAASASHIYGPELEYVVQAYSCLEDKDRDLFLFLRMHMRNSVGFYPNFDKK
ncbi:Xaa-Pro dipeptidyl-peptidase [Actinidia chinensis var. chinensis]|uniref:Xaa-Pro dipeptidyl-peptidase n=1 Tax=Actinidia chinensis var. chinensis TaxID=1590841 RepID=A0A2R6PRM7_ACTCC|nr:Xaa-Pro dipeptidyl-peptidase [Actinidia chinensis var. chinensis]